ncbi:hypothetical protein BAE44_0002299, partial [Dichanthelium oligosanthes]
LHARGDVALRREREHQDVSLGHGACSLALVFTEAEKLVCSHWMPGCCALSRWYIQPCVKMAPGYVALLIATNH